MTDRIAQDIEREALESLAQERDRIIEACKYGWLSYILYRIGSRLSHWRHCILLWVWCHAGVYLIRHPDTRPKEKEFLRFSIKQYQEIQAQYGKHILANVDGVVASFKGRKN